MCRRSHPHVLRGPAFSARTWLTCRLLRVHVVGREQELEGEGRHRRDADDADVVNHVGLVAVVVGIHVVPRLQLTFGNDAADGGDGREDPAGEVLPNGVQLVHLQLVDVQHGLLQAGRLLGKLHQLLLGGQLLMLPAMLLLLVLDDGMLLGLLLLLLLLNAGQVLWVLRQAGLLQGLLQFVLLPSDPRLAGHIADHLTQWKFRCGTGSDAGSGSRLPAAEGSCQSHSSRRRRA